MTAYFAVPPRTLTGLGVSVLIGAALASVVSLVLIFVLPGDTASLDQTLPANGPFGQLISDIVPFVWVGLFGGLGAAYWLVTAGTAAVSRAGWAIVGLLAVCVLYPVLAANVSAPMQAIAGNGVVIVMALATAALCWGTSHVAAVLTAAVAVWVSLATIGLAALQMGVAL